MRKLGSALAYYVLCALTSPLILVGYIVWVRKTSATRRSGVSGTAQGPLAARFTDIPGSYSQVMREGFRAIEAYAARGRADSQA